MEPLLPAYKAVGERRYRETSGLYWEDFEPGDVFEHRPGRTVLDVDNTYFTLLTLNIQQIHFDAASGEFGRAGRRGCLAACQLRRRNYCDSRCGADGRAGGARRGCEGR
jgi:hypothetical protein